MISTRRKACDACVKAKRRCLPDRYGRPCTRCKIRDLRCSLSTAVDSEDAFAICRCEENDPQEELHRASNMWMATAEAGWGSPINMLDNAEGISMNPEPACTVSLNPFRLHTCIQRLLKCITSMAREARTPFRKPFSESIAGDTSFIDDAYLCCVAFRNKTDATKDIVSRTCARSFGRLVHRLGDAISFPERLVTLQAILIFQIMAYFGCEAGSCEIAERCAGLIEKSVHTLQDDLLNYSSGETGVMWAHQSQYQQWLLLESARRTILAHMFIKAVYLHIRRGFCELVPKLAVLPLTIDGDLWNASSEAQWHMLIENQLHPSPNIKPYLEAIDVWTMNGQDNMDDFGIMLLGVCKDIKN
jgi:hypothetical protein